MEEMKIKTFTELIRCPRCGAIQEAEVEATIPWATYIHNCKKCGYTIMESEWDRVSDADIVLYAVSDVTGVSVSDLKSRKRKARIAEARGLYYAVCMELGVHQEQTVVTIRRHRSTVSTMGKKYLGICEMDKALNELKNNVLKKVRDEQQAIL